MDLVNASFALPFCAPEMFDDLWQRLCESLAEDGWFSGHFFGPNDDWASRGLTIHRRDGKTAVGTLKHWHLFEVVARRS